MTTHTVTTSNWNLPSFWSGLSLANGDTLDLSALGPGFTFEYQSGADRMVISNGSTSFSIGGATNPNEDVSLTGFGVDAFDTIIGPDGAMNVQHGSEANDIQGGGDADTIQSGGGNDTISGGAGNDVIGAGTGNDSVDGGAGNDSINGSDGNDTIDGGDGQNQITGGDGDDSLIGSATDEGGYTNMQGGAGADTIDGSIGQWDIATYYDSDAAVSVDLTDTLAESDGHAEGDTLIGIEQIDGSNLFGDKIVGDAGVYEIKGFGGDDNLQLTTAAGGVIDGGDGADTIVGGAGSDALNGETGDDSITGAGGDDTIRGGTGADTMDGGNDADTFIIEDNFGADSIIGGEGGVDEDTVDLSELTGAVTVAYTDDEIGTATDGNDTLNFSQIENLTLTDFNDSVDATDTDGVTISAGLGDDTILGGNRNGFASPDSIDAGGGNDSVFGGWGEDTILGGDGNDTIDGGDQGDIIDGGAGNDSIEAGEEDGVGDSDSIRGGDGDDTITSAETDTGSNDSLYGDAGNDRISVTGGTDNLLSGGTGDDTLTGGTGSDTLDGGEGSDSFLIQDGFGTDTVIGGEDALGTDTLDMRLLSTGVSVTYDGDESAIVQQGANSIDFSEIESISLTNQNDTLDASVDTAGLEAWTGAGDDTILGGSGNDTIFAEGGSDTIDGGAGDDNIDGGNNDDTVSGGAGNDTLIGGTGADILSGDADNDVIFAGVGNDTLAGGTGNDALYGGEGDDSFVVENSFGTDTVVGGEDATDTDMLDLSAVTEDLHGRFTSTEAGYFETATDRVSFSEIERITLGQGNDQQAWGSNSNDPLWVDGQAGNDTLLGSTQNDTYYGGDDDDYLVGNGGDDSLLGEDGNDDINGGAGNDTLIGGTGDDELTGGGDDDTFSYTQGDGNDTITDFGFGNTGAVGDSDSSNNDFIDLSAFYTDIAEMRADFADNQRFDHSNSSTADYSDNTSFSGGSVEIDNASSKHEFTADNTGVVCFANGTLIATSRGTVPVEALSVGDMVMTVDRGLQPIRWIGARKVSAQDMQRNFKLRPVRIKAGSLGEGLPKTDLLVSRQHRMLVASKICERVFGNNELLVAAVKLTEIDGVDTLESQAPLTYYHLLFDHHEVIWANGTPSESLHLGKETLKTLPPKALQELRTLFPQIETQALVPIKARLVPHKGAQVQKLIGRHVRNGKPMLESFAAF